MTAKAKALFLGLTLFLIITWALLLFYSQNWQDSVSLRTRQNTSLDREFPATSSIAELQKELPEVDFDFWYQYAQPDNYGINWTCAKYPDPLDLQLHNYYWQTFSNANVTFRLYAAYLDKREALNSSSGHGVVRILATANQSDNEFPSTHCQLWFLGHKQPIVTPISEYSSVWLKVWGLKPRLSYPHILSCPVPDTLPSNLAGSNPSTVSLTTQFCEHASNSLRVHYDTSNNKVTKGISSKAPGSSVNSSAFAEVKAPPLNFGVCLKAFDFPFEDISGRLIEWFELQRLLGATRIYGYVYQVHPQVQRTLAYYEHSGFLELRPLTMANGIPRLPHYLHLLLKNRLMVKRLNELIPYNDCFYRNMYRHDYVVNVDIDEVIMPMGELRNWQQLLAADGATTRSKCPQGHTSLCLIESIFPIRRSKVQELFMLQNTWRHRNHTKENVATKCFHNTRFSLTLHNHYTLKSLPNPCSRRFLSTQLAQMQHYKDKDTNETTLHPSKFIEDRSIWRFETDLRAAVKHVWKQL
ncbi:hypothetical protein ACLKA7_000597 [Drosophila subpalustris]